MKFADHAREYVMVSDDLHREIREEQFLYINKYVIPLTGGTGIRISCMWDIAGQYGDITLVKGLFRVAKTHRSAVRAADADLQTVVKMERRGGNVRDTSFFSS